MNRKRIKFILIVVLVIGLISMTIAYAQLSQKLEIKSQISVKNGSWDIHFANAKLVENTFVGNTAEIKSPLTLSPFLLSGLEVELKKPGDTISYTFDVYNSGSLDAQITELKNHDSIICTDENGSTTSMDATNVCKNIIYTIKYTDKTTTFQTEYEIPKDTDVNINQILKANNHVNMTLTISYNKQSDYIPKTNVYIKGLSSYIIYTQK